MTPPLAECAVIGVARQLHTRCARKGPTCTLALTLPARPPSLLPAPPTQGELDVAAAKIQELISTLDARKDEAIERTFKGVAKHFREVFADLVPGAPWLWLGFWCQVGTRATVRGARCALAGAWVLVSSWHQGDGAWRQVRPGCSLGFGVKLAPGAPWLWFGSKCQPPLRNEVVGGLLLRMACPMQARVCICSCAPAG